MPKGDGVSEGQAAFALTQAILTLLIRVRAMTHQGAGVLVPEAAALLKGFDNEGARTVLFDLAQQYGAENQKRAGRRRSR